jgi:hypothetical protein
LLALSVFNAMHAFALAVARILPWLWPEFFQGSADSAQQPSKAVCRFLRLIDGGNGHILGING